MILCEQNSRFRLNFQYESYFAQGLFFVGKYAKIPSQSFTQNMLQVYAQNVL